MREREREESMVGTGIDCSGAEQAGGGCFNGMQEHHDYWR